VNLVLEDVSFDVAEGESLVLLEHPGAERRPFFVWLPASTSRIREGCFFTQSVTEAAGA